MSVTLEEFEARKSSYTGRPRKENPADYVDLREKFSTYDALEYEQKNSPYNQDWKALTAFKNGLQSVGEGISGFGVMIQDMVIDSAKEHNPDNSQLDLWKQSIHEHHEADREGIYKQTPVASSSDIGQLGLDVVQGAAQMVPAAVASLLPGGQAVGALVMGASIAGNEYDELRDQGVDERTAASAATINALIQTPFEYIGLSKIFKGLPVTSSLKGYAREFAERVATEGITEFIQEYPEQVSRLWALNSDKPIEDVAEVVRNELGNITSDAAYSGLIGGILGGGLGGAHMGLSSSFQHAMTKEIHNTKMDIVEKQIENITATETNPAVAATVINSTTNNEMVYVDGSTVQEYAQTSGNMRELAIVLGVQEEDIKRAAADGDYLDVRLGNFEAAAAKYNGFFQAVKDDTSFEDGGYTVNGEKLYKQEIEQVKRKTAELEVEQDNVLNSMLTAGVERKQANALLTILTNYAMMMHPENPAQWMRENGLKFQKGGVVGNAFNQAQYKSDAKSMKEYVAKIKEANIPPQGKGKFYYSFKSSKGADLYIAHDDMKHSYEKHGLTDGQLDAVESNIENITGAAVDNKKKGHNTGVPVLAKIKTPAGMAGVAFEFHPNGTVGINTIFFDSEANIDNWLKKGGSSTIVPLEEQTSLTGNTPLSISTIQDKLGIVKYNQLGEVVESQKADVRTKYEGTDQWMKAPNGKTTNLTEDQWLAVRTPAFKEWFGDWEKKPKQASKIVDENGEPMVVYHGTPLGGFTEFKRELNYFTADKEYADRYQDPGASSDYVKGVHEELGDAMTYPVFLNIRKPFDTRKAKERKIFENEFYRQWGNGAPLSEKGLPDWTDSDDFREFFEENEYDYDGLLLDEGGVPGEDGEVKSRGISYVAFESNQIKSATDNNGNYDSNAPNIYHQDNSVIKGAFNPEMQDGQYIISLFKGADASTVIHETGHYFIETMWKAIESGQATKQVEKDFDTLLEYAGMTREQWAAADVQGRSAAHERLAEAFESYIMEGKAPSEQLREAFRKFAEWLKAVYKTIRRSENAIPLTDDVRQVFDRMLAAQDDIAEAERVNKYFAELPKAITENMSEATKARVEKFIDNAREKALDVLTRKAMENFSSERQEEISNYRAEVLPEVTEEIKERRTYKNGYTREDVKKYQALQDIVTGENEVGKELTPEDEVYMMQFDLTAESFGYSSTNEMVQDIMNSPTEKQAITQAVNELVNAKFPDYMTEKKAREEAIQEAIYNDENSLLIGVEQQLIEEYATKAMNRQMEAEAKKEAAKVEGGEKKQGPAAKTKEEMRIRAAAYRQQAKTMAKEAIGRMIISDATRTQKYVTLERRAAMKSAECMAKKDYREALTQKNLQAYYHAMVQESIKAKRTVDKNRRYLKRQVKAKKEAWVSEAHFAEVSALFMRMGIAHKKHDDTGRIGVTLREYADAMNEKYDCAEFADWLLNMPDYEPLSDTRMYTLEQFNDMVDAVRNIRAIAKAEKGAGMFEKAESFEALKKDILENLNKLKTVFAPDPNKPTQATLTERFWAALENSDTFFERMDNWSQGFFTNTFFAKIKHSNDMEYDCREKYDKAVIEANNEWLPDKAAMAAAEEKIYYEELGTSVSKHILVKMLMNMGNKENARRLAETCPIGFEKGTIWNPMSEDSMLLPEEALELTQHNILEFLQNNLTAEDVRYAQKMVNAAGSFWTEKNEMEKRVKGFGLKKVEATPQVLTIGGKEVVFQGGYFPLIRNGELGSHPVTQEVGADDPLQGRNIRTLHTNSGSTKHRTLGAKYPVNLFPGAETQVMYDSIHDLCWRECVNDFRRVLNDGDIYTALKTKLGPARMSVFREMLEKAAQPNSTQSADFAERTVGAAASWLRNKSANAIIMMNLKINLQNFGNVFLFGQSVEGFGHADTLHALGNFKMNFADAKGYSDLTEFIFSKSAFMRERMTIPDISVRDIMEDPTNKQSEFEKSVLRLGTKLMVYTDGITAKPVWLEAYRKSLANGKTEQEAVDFADTVIRRTLGSTRMTDVSSLQRGGAIYKLMTMFQSFFNTQYNQWVREKNLVQKMYTEGQKREAFENAFAFVTSKFVFTCMASLALSLENPFGIDDDDGWPELLKEMKNYSFSMFGPVGQVGSNLVGNMLGMKEFGYRMSVVQSTLEKMTRTGKTVNKVVTGESKTPVADMAETTTDVAGFVLGVPQQVNKVLWNTYDILVNDMDPRLEDLTRRRPKKERKPDK